MENTPIKIEGTITPLSFYHSYDSLLFLDNSNKVLLPTIIFNQIVNYANISFPLTISINDTIMGIHEILEDIDQIYIPEYICKKINLCEPTQLELTFIDNSQFPKGEYIKLKPHQSIFYEIIDTRGFLENNLKKLYTHLEKNQVIHIPHNDTILYFDVVEIKPDTIVSLNDTDVEVDFEQAYDYVEPPVIEKNDINAKLKFKFKHGPALPTDDTPVEPDPSIFVPFSGTGRKLGGGN
jgi:hypothetical protein